MVEAFKLLLLDLGESIASPMGLDFARIDDSDAVSLETPFSKEEV